MVTHRLYIRQLTPRDALNDLLSVTQGSQKPGCTSQGVQVSRSFSYDLMGRLTGACTPESGTTSYTYPTSAALCSGDPSTVCTRTDARGTTTTYKYDVMNRLTSKTYSDSTPTATYFYDVAPAAGNWPAWTNVTNVGFTYAKGRMVLACTGSSINTCTSPSTAAGFSYDQMGRGQHFWQCTPYNCGSTSIWDVQDTYDKAGDIATWSHPYPYTITNQINAAQQTTAITSSWSDSNHPATVAENMSYNAWGAPTQLENGCVGSGCGNGVETYVYNNRLQLVAIGLGNPTDLSYVCMEYNYYADVAMSSLPNCTSTSAPPAPPQGTKNNGNVWGSLDQDNWYPSFCHDETYTYDNVNRLATAQGTTPTSCASGTSTYGPISYNYDAYGNMSCTTSGQCQDWTYNSSTNQISSSGFGYDLSGDLTTDAATTRTYAWDAEGRLTKVTDNGGNGTTTTYVYNALGQEVELNASAGQLEQIFNPQGERVGYYSGANSQWLLGYVPWNGREIARYAWSTYFDFSHPNGLGSGWLSNDQTGTVVQDEAYKPWGQQWLNYGSAYDSHFARIHASLQGPSWVDYTMYEAPFRFYAPNPGRWHSPDPLGGDVTNPQSLNRYAYSLNNPASFTDPTGLDGGLGLAGWDCNAWNPYCTCDATDTEYCGPPPPSSCSTFFGFICPPPAGGGPTEGGPTASGPTGPAEPPICNDCDPAWGPPPSVLGGWPNGDYGPFTSLTLGDLLGIPVGGGICDFGNCGGISGNQFQAAQTVQYLVSRGWIWVEWCLNTPGCTNAIKWAGQKAWEGGKAALDASFGCIDAPCIQRALQNIQQQQINGTWEASGTVPQPPSGGVNPQSGIPNPKTVVPQSGGSGGSW
jgi:RHS repeat-associated protein